MLDTERYSFILGVMVGYLFQISSTKCKYLCLVFSFFFFFVVVCKP